MAIRTAEKLLKEVRPKSAKAEQKIRVLENRILLATKSKPNVERALERFADMASSEVSEISGQFYISTESILEPHAGEYSTVAIIFARDHTIADMTQLPL